MLGPALRVRGVISGADGLDDLREAVTLLDQSPARIHLTRALIALGTALQRAGQAAEARAPLERAALSWPPHAVLRGSSKLRAGSARNGRRERSRQSLRIRFAHPNRAASGRADCQRTSDREIAQTLFETPNGVQLHVAGVFEKLGVDSRAGVALALEPGA